MKTVGFLLLALIGQSCFYHPYYKDSEWWYFEEWDINQDRMLDKNEFETAFKKNKIARKFSSRPMSLADFQSRVDRLEKETGEHPEDKPALSSFDTNGDHVLSQDELAAAIFAISDDNHDNELSSLEFYEWEVYL